MKTFTVKLTLTFWEFKADTAEIAEAKFDEMVDKLMQIKCNGLEDFDKTEVEITE